MTDLLTRDPNDTGDIPAVGETTRRIDTVGDGIRNLAPYAAGMSPRFRRPAAVLALTEPRSCRRIDWNDPELTEPTGPTAPPPPPEPEPKDEIVWALAERRSVLYVPSAERKPGPRGRHRKPSHWDWLTVPLAMAWQRIVGAV